MEGHAFCLMCKLVLSCEATVDTIHCTSNVINGFGEMNDMFLLNITPGSLRSNVSLQNGQCLMEPDMKNCLYENSFQSNQLSISFHLIFDWPDSSTIFAYTVIPPSSVSESCGNCLMMLPEASPKPSTCLHISFVILFFDVTWCKMKGTVTNQFILKAAICLRPSWNERCCSVSEMMME